MQELTLLTNSRFTVRYYMTLLPNLVLDILNLADGPL